MKKSIIYSQNFLVSKALVAGLIDKSSIEAQDVVYDIGAGGGIITEALAKRCSKVVAIEIDTNFYNKLVQKFAQIPTIEVHKANFLTYTLPNADYKVFSNIPFNITADVVKKLTNSDNQPKDTYLIVQKEAAAKFAGKPLGNETQTSLFIKPWFEPSVVHLFRRVDFKPIPQVDIVLFRLKLRNKSLVYNTKLYKDFIAFSFSQWKSTLQEGLKAIFTNDQFVRLSRDLKFPLHSTPTQLNFDQWLGLYNYFSIGVNNHKKQIIIGAASKLLIQQKGLQKIHRTRVAKDWRGTA